MASRANGLLLTISLQVVAVVGAVIEMADYLGTDWSRVRVHRPRGSQQH